MAPSLKKKPETNLISKAGGASKDNFEKKAQGAGNVLAGLAEKPKNEGFTELKHGHETGSHDEVSPLKINIRLDNIMENRIDEQNSSSDRTQELSGFLKDEGNGGKNNLNFAEDGLFDSVIPKIKEIKILYDSQDDFNISGRKPQPIDYMLDYPQANVSNQRSNINQNSGINYDSPDASIVQQTSKIFNFENNSNNSTLRGASSKPVLKTPGVFNQQIPKNQLLQSNSTPYLDNKTPKQSDSFRHSAINQQKQNQIHTHSNQELNDSNSRVSKISPKKSQNHSVTIQLDDDSNFENREVRNPLFDTKKQADKANIISFDYKNVSTTPGLRPITPSANREEPITVK